MRGSCGGRRARIALAWLVVAAFFLRPFALRWYARRGRGTPPLALRMELEQRSTAAEPLAAVAAPPMGAIEPAPPPAPALPPPPTPPPPPRPPPHWAADRNDWWEGGLQLAARPGGPAARRTDILVCVLSGRSAKYAARRESIRTTWAADLVPTARQRRLNLRLVFAVSDNFCDYQPSALAGSVASFPSARCKEAREHSAGGQLSDEHAALLQEYRAHTDLVFVPRTVDEYYSSAAKMRTLYKCIAAAKLDFGLLIKLDDDAVLLRKPFFEHYDAVREHLDPGVGGAAMGPRWWGTFNEWWAPVRAKDEAHEVQARTTRKEHAWTVTHDEWPFHWFPTFPVGTGHALNRAAVDCFGRLADGGRGGKDGRDGSTIDGGTSVWMEDVAHGVWFDVCAAAAEASATSERERGCRLVSDLRFPIPCAVVRVR